jgi:hypothetical protein
MLGTSPAAPSQNGPGTNLMNGIILGQTESGGIIFGGLDQAEDQNEAR